MTCKHHSELSFDLPPGVELDPADGITLVQVQLEAARDHIERVNRRVADVRPVKCDHLSIDNSVAAQLYRLACVADAGKRDVCREIAIDPDVFHGHTEGIIQMAQWLREGNLTDKGAIEVFEGRGSISLDC
ncbi:MAG: hypothetical protein AABO57_05470 [Acidobacteriota bacterium]